MTNLEIMAQHLSEVTGHPREAMEHVVRETLTSMGIDVAEMLDEVPDAEARRQLVELRQNQGWLAVQLLRGGWKGGPWEATRAAGGEGR